MKNTLDKLLYNKILNYDNGTLSEGALIFRTVYSKKVGCTNKTEYSAIPSNTTDCLEMVRKLKDQGIYVKFESENIHTESMDSELILSILGGLAEGESKSISLNSKWSMKRRFETGAFKHTSAPYGYDYKDGGLIPNAEEAAIVERIFREYLAGQGTPRIADGLNGDAIPSRKGRAWSSTVVRRCPAAKDLHRRPVQPPQQPGAADPIPGGEPP